MKQRRTKRGGPDPAHDSRLKDSVRLFERSAVIGSRLRQMRLALSLSQEEAAERLIITRERLANYEDGRTPLKLQIGLRFCDIFVVSERWLASGVGPFRQCMDLLHDPAAQNLDADLPFIDAFERVLSARYEQILATHPAEIRFSDAGESPAVDLQLIDCFLSTWRACVAPSALNGLMQRLVEAGNEYCARHCDGALSEEEIKSLLEEQGLPLPGKAILAAHKRAAARRAQGT